MLIQITHPDGGSATYSYDTANRLSSMTDWNGRNATFSYDNVGRRLGLSMPNGTKTSYSYDPAGRLIDLLHKTGGGSLLGSFSYAYDQIGNRLSITMPEEKRAYAYDLLDRLIKSTPTKLPGADIEMMHKAEDFSYDLVGNRITGPEAIDTYVYNQGNQLVSDRKNQYQYDRNGNLISKTEVGDDGTTKNWTYSYESENRLIKVIKQEVGGTKTITFKYDPFGRRIEKKVDGVVNGISEKKTYSYVYDNEDIIAEYLNKIESGISKIETTKYLHGPGIDEPLEIDRKGATYSYHTDGLGSMTALSDSTQKAMERYSYSAFGDLKRQGDKVKNTYTFTGREWDEEMGLYYYRARYLDTETGRFTSKDPIGIQGGINFYLYVDDNPINRIDPLGLKGSCDAQLPASPIKEVALTCFAEASNNCAQGGNEKRAITDCIYNRANKNKNYWCGNSVLGVLGCTYNGKQQFLGYGSSQYKKAEDSCNLDQKECQKLKDCISAAQASSTASQYSYTSFNQTFKVGRDSICSHYFWTDKAD